MAFRFQPDESVERGVRRLARGQIDRALEGLDGGGEAGPEEVVHDARKRFKKVRALIRLARGGLGRKRADREDVRFRDAGRPLSEARDAAALLQAFDRLVEWAGDRARPEAVGPFRAALVRRRDEATRGLLADGGFAAGLGSALEEARRDVKRWDMRGDDWEALEGGLRWVYKRGQRAFRRALEDPTDENLHDWRKRVKDLWYALDLLAPIRPAAVDPRGEEASRLADILGDDHDLAVLDEILEDEARRGLGDAVGAIRPLIRGRRSELRRDAYALGPAVYAERPGRFVARMGAYWRAWRAAREAARFDRA